ncbi:MAG: nucleoside-diphosphate sugar epimerase/dehydratase [Rhodothermales bacterium]
MRERLLGISRLQKQAVVALVDVATVTAALCLSLWLRLGDITVPVGDQVLLILLAPLVAVPIFGRFGLYRAVFRYVSIHMGWAILKSVAVLSAVLGLGIYLTGAESIPRSLVLINAFVVFVGVSGTRVLARWCFSSEMSTFNGRGAGKRERVLIYGAGAAGVQLASALAHSREVDVAGFVDDDRELQRHSVRGIRVHAPEDLALLVPAIGVTEVLMAMPSATKARVREIVASLDKLRVEVRTLPGLAELAQGRVQVSDLRRVEITDILGRNPVQPNTDLLTRNIAGRSVLVTGAGGSIGSELCRQIAALSPTRIVLFERSEFALYEIERELRRTHPGLTLIPILGSVLDESHVEHVMRQNNVETVYHAAAYKHVPLVEANPAQGVYNNVFGTWRTARAAQAAGVGAFVLISTDKAVRPTNVMGASKRLAEMVLQCMAQNTDMVLTMVRFGNVLGSSGSVVPLFKEQIQAGGPVTVTHPDVTRYFMTIPEASQLVIQAGAMGSGGDVFVLDMGEPVRIVDLARRMIRLSGFDVREADHPTGDIEIAFSGLRPGEKLYEELLIGSNTSTTEHPLILRAEEHFKDEESVEWILSELEDAILKSDANRIVSLMHAAVDEYAPAVHDTPLLA